MTDELNSADALRANRDKLVTDVVAVTAETGELLKKFSSASLDSAGDAIAGAQAVVVDNARKVAGATGDYVQAHPWKALVVAATTGVVLGLLLARRPA